MNKIKQKEAVEGRLFVPRVKPAASLDAVIMGSPASVLVRIRDLSRQFVHPAVVEAMVIMVETAGVDEASVVAGVVMD